MSHTRTAGVIFAATALFHAARVVGFPLAVRVVPVWMSGLLVVLAAGVVVAYVRTCPEPMPWQYGLTGLLFSAILLLHLSRLTRGEEVLLINPLWPGYIAAPVMSYLAVWNWNLRLPRERPPAM